MEELYRKDLSHLTWDEVFARQVRRAALVEDWTEALQLQPGARVLDIGAGPGYVSLVLAERVGPDGLVYAVDRSADALFPGFPARATTSSSSASRRSSPSTGGSGGPEAG